MSITNIRGTKTEASLEQKYDAALQELNFMQERLVNIWWMLTDVRDQFDLGIGPRSYLNAAIALAETFVDDEK